MKNDALVTLHHCGVLLALVHRDNAILTKTVFTLFMQQGYYGEFLTHDFNHCRLVVKKSIVSIERYDQNSSQE